MKPTTPKPHRLLSVLLAVLVIGIAAGYFARGYHISPGLLTASVTPFTGITSPAPVAELPNAACHARDTLPDPTCTPGVSDPAVTQANIASTICVPGYTKTVRPTVSYTDKLKTQQMRQYGYTDSIHLHEEDHLISLELGGSPSDPKNLWPEPGQSPNPKDKVENALHAAVCSGRLTLTEAQNRITTDWTTGLQGL